jgi:hypothetical protein
MNSGNVLSINNELSEVSIKVNIPCTGHSFLIIQEIRKDKGVNDVKFKVPDVFSVKYNPIDTSPQQILSSEIFKTYPAVIQ